MPSLTAAISAALLLALTPLAHAQDKAVTPEEARGIAREATIYGFPLVDNYRILYSFFVDKQAKEYKGPWNVIHNEANVLTPKDRAIQTPNSDTPYSHIGTDLRAEPIVLSVPAAESRSHAPSGLSNHVSLALCDAARLWLPRRGTTAGSGQNAPRSTLSTDPPSVGVSPRRFEAIRQILQIHGDL